MTILINLPDGTDREMHFPADDDLVLAIAEAKLAFPEWTSLLITIVRS